MTHERMVGFWPTEAAATDDPVVAEKMNTLPRIVFSQTLSHVEWGKWENARLAKEDLRETIVALKQEPGKDLLVGGGDALYLCYWMRQSGLADLLPSLNEAV
jgi:hypothetical protein